MKGKATMLERYGWIDKYLMQKPGATRDYKEAWGWHRYMVGEKMFAALCKPEEKYGEYGGHDLLSLKCDMFAASMLRERHPAILPGFYMNKDHWNSVLLEGEVPGELILSMCDDSYRLIFNTLTKRTQRQIQQESPPHE